MAPDHVILYRAPASSCNVESIASWLDQRIDAAVTVRDRFIDVHDRDGIAETFAQSRVLSPFDRETGSKMYGIVRYEKRMLKHPERSGGVLYDGIAIQRDLNERLPDDERSLDTFHIAVFDRHIGTWGDHDGRWHKRIAVLGQPTLLSVPGVPEAPAKPEAYYKLKQQHALLAGDAPPRELLEGAIDDDVLVPGDPRTTDVLYGYALAGFHLIKTGEAFCDDPRCRLFNGHRHNEVIRAQLESPEFCETHSARYSG